MPDYLLLLKKNNIAMIRTTIPLLFLSTFFTSSCMYVMDENALRKEPLTYEQEQLIMRINNLNKKTHTSTSMLHYLMDVVETLFPPRKEPHYYEQLIHQLNYLLIENTAPITIAAKKTKGKKQLPSSPLITKNPELTKEQENLVECIMGKERPYKMSPLSFRKLYNTINFTFPYENQSYYRTMLHDKLNQLRIDHAISVLSFAPIKNKALLTYVVYSQRIDQALLALTTLAGFIAQNSDKKDKHYCIQQLYGVKPAPFIVDYKSDPSFARKAYYLLQTISEYNGLFTPDAYYDYKIIQTTTEKMEKEITDLSDFSKQSIEELQAQNINLANIISDEEQDLQMGINLEILLNEKSSQLEVDRIINIISLPLIQLVEVPIQERIKALKILEFMACKPNQYCQKQLQNALPNPHLLEYKINVTFAQQAYPVLQSLGTYNKLFKPHAYFDYQTLKKEVRALVVQNDHITFSLQTIESLQAKNEDLKKIIPHENRSNLIDYDLKRLCLRVHNNGI
jgi:hypothetical protein